MVGYLPVCDEVVNLFIKPQNLLAFFFIRKRKSLYLIATVCDGLLMIFLHFVCKLLSNPWENHNQTMLSEDFCLSLSTSKNQFVHPFLVDVIVIFSRVPGPIHEVCFKNKLCHLSLMSVIFSATKVLYKISSLGGHAKHRKLTADSSICVVNAISLLLITLTPLTLKDI